MGSHAHTESAAPPKKHLMIGSKFKSVGRIAVALCVAAVCSVAGVCWLAGSALAADVAVLRNGFTIRHDHRIVMGETTRLFTSADDSSFTDVATGEITGFEKDLTPPPPAPAAAPASFPATAPARAIVPKPAPPPVDLNQVVNSASAAYHLDPDLVNSVIHAESAFNTRAISPKGARGLMQLMPSTANALGVNNSFDPQENVGGGSQYLRELLERYNYDMVKALAAYNAGPERVDQYGGVPPFRETRSYVARIVHDYNQKKIAQEKAAARAQKQSGTQSAKATPAKASAASSASAGSGKTRKRAANSSAQLATGSTSANTPR